MTKHLVIFGAGYTAMRLIPQAQKAGYKVSASYRNENTYQSLKTLGVRAFPFKESINEGTNKDSLANLHTAPVSHILNSVPPAEKDDPVIAAYGAWIKAQKKLEWVGYLSTTGVYGDHKGAWVDEETPPKSPGLRGMRRLQAESKWRDLCHQTNATLHIFRLAGIYGPGRNQVRALLDGTARHIVKHGQFFNRIHVGDIVGTLMAAMENACVGDQVFNLADSQPTPSHTILRMAADALNIMPPEAIPFEKADLSAMARAFYADNKRVAAGHVQHVLGYKLRYPTFADALPELIASEGKD